MAFAFSLSFDFLVVGEETTLSLPEIKYDIDSTGTLESLALIVGSRVAREIAIMGEEFDGQRAYELGLADDPVPEDRSRRSYI